MEQSTSLQKCICTCLDGSGVVCTLINIDPIPLSRITITLDDSQHRSLKLLSILENKTLAQVLQEAIQDHLQRKGADRLEVTQGQELGGNG